VGEQGEMVMNYCDICPYPAKCENRGRCQIGQPVKAAPAVAEEKPKAVKKKERK